MRHDYGIWVVRALASEGKYLALRQLRDGRRLFLGAKCLITSWNYFFGKTSARMSTKIAYTKGRNQVRVHLDSSDIREQRVGKLDHYNDRSGNEDASLLPRIRVKEFLMHVFVIILLVLTGRKRFLLLYYFIFYKSIRRIVEEEMASTEFFLCYNDRPFDVTALVLALNSHTQCRTITVQHGLILGLDLYFPSCTHEFWAWGELTREFFHSRTPDSELIVTGRSLTDKIRLSTEPIFPKKGEVTFLVALSLLREHIFPMLDIVEQQRQFFTFEQRQKTRFLVKLHPTTKRVKQFKKTLSRRYPWISFTADKMDQLAHSADMLIMHNSTSAVDFLLLGKPVFCAKPNNDNVFPSSKYVYELTEILGIYNEFQPKPTKARLEFLRNSINV